MSRNKTLLLALLLTLPVIAFLIHYYTSHASHLHPTGFTVDENVLYMSYAHQYIDQENFSLFYSNPFDGDPKSPAIYFQPATLVFATLLKAGADPGFTFSMFGLIMAFCCIYVAIKIIQHLLPTSKHQALIALLFTWGGGLTAIAGMGSALVSGASLNSFSDSIYLADPANGWWGMNWGRTLFIPLEAFYHFLFFTAIYLLLKQKWKSAVGVIILLSISHPFTGVEFLLIINGWLLLEKIIYRNKNIPQWFLPTTLCILLFHIGYYLFYMNSFPEHQQLFAQYSAGWTYSFRVFIPAYAIVFFLCAISYYRSKPLFKFLAEPHQRLFLCWAIIAFLLSKHEWFIKPMQPIHFTRGYIWAGLFLLGLPGLVWLINYGKKNLSRKILLAAFILIFLMDNILWIANDLRQKHTEEWEGHISNETQQVFDFLKKSTNSKDLLLGNASLVNYMSNVYSSANAWVSHPYNTPNRIARTDTMMKYFTTGVKPASWNGRRLLLAWDKKKEQVSVAPPLQSNKVFENDRYIIFTP